MAAAAALPRLLVAALLTGGCRAGGQMLTVISPMHKSASVHIRKLLLHAVDCIVDDNATRHRAWGVAERCAPPSYGNASSCSRDLTRFSRNPATLLATVRRLLGPNCLAFSACRAMLHIRHPFDVLVSMFDAWTSTATTEFNKSLAGKSQADRDEQARRRDELRAEGVDAYVLSRMNQVFTKMGEALNTSLELESVCSPVWLSRYEDVVARPSWWLEQLLHFLSLSDTAAGRHHAALTRTRAAQLRARASAPDPRTHLHTIVSGGFVTRLAPDTQIALLREAGRHPMVLHASGYF